MSGETEWRWADPHGQQRLIREDELRAALANGVIPPNAPVWRRGWPAWQPAFDVTELMTSALSAANGVVPNIPPPPLFVVAAQSAFEGSPRPPDTSTGQEPPPPPHYVPAPVPVRDAPVSSSNLSRPPPVSAAPVSARPAPHKPVAPGTHPPAPVSTSVPSRPPPSSMPISQRMSATEALKRSVPSTVKLPSLAPKPPGSPDSTARFPADEAHAPPALAPIPASYASPDREPNAGAPAGSPENPAARVNTMPSSGVKSSSVKVPAATPAVPRTQSKAIAIPTVVGVPRLDASGAPPSSPNAAHPVSGSGLVHTPPLPTAADRLRADPSRSTLLFDGSAPSGATGPSSAASPPPPIVATGPGQGAVVEKNAVTRPPPIDMGTVQVSPGTARDAQRDSETEEELSGSMLIEQTDAGPILHSKPGTSKPPPPPVKRSSKPPSPGLRALSAGPPRTLSRPPAPMMDAFGAPGDEPVISEPLLSPLAPPSQRKPATPPPAADVAEPGSREPFFSPPTLLGVGPIPSHDPPPADLMEQVRDELGSDFPAAGQSGRRGQAARPEWLARVLKQFPQLEPLQRGRPIFFLPVVGGLAALVALITFGLLVRGCIAIISPSEDKRADKTSVQDADSSSRARAIAKAGSGTLPPPSPAAAETAAAATTASPASESASITCRATGTQKSLAPKAVVGSGVEAIAFAKTIGIGFATSPKDGIALEVDPTTLNVTSTARAHGADLKRVTPLQTGGHLVAIGDSDRRGAITSGRVVAGSGGTSSFVIGARDGQLALVQHGTAITNLWPLLGDASAPVEAVRGASDGGGWSVAFRRGAAIYFGSIGNQMKPLGGLVETPGFGTQVGSPSVATSAGITLAMWADRSSPDQPWALRMRRARGSQAPEEARAFTPSGGPGAPFIAPSVVGLEAGRFLVVWTEGPAQSHQVRGATLNAEGQIDGAPFALSPPTVNAGQAQVALDPEGRGVVAYLVGNGHGFEVAGAGVTCTNR